MDAQKKEIEDLIAKTIRQIGPLVSTKNFLVTSRLKIK